MRGLWVAVAVKHTFLLSLPFLLLSTIADQPSNLNPLAHSLSYRSHKPVWCSSYWSCYVLRTAISNRIHRVKEHLRILHARMQVRLRTNVGSVHAVITLPSERGAFFYSCPWKTNQTGCFSPAWRKRNRRIQCNVSLGPTYSRVSANSHNMFQVFC